MRTVRADNGVAGEPTQGGEKQPDLGKRRVRQSHSVGDFHSGGNNFVAGQRASDGVAGAKLLLNGDGFVQPLFELVQLAVYFRQFVPAGFSALGLRGFSLPFQIFNLLGQIGTVAIGKGELPCNVLLLLRQDFQQAGGFCPRGRGPLPLGRALLCLCRNGVGDVEFGPYHSARPGGAGAKEGDQRIGLYVFVPCAGGSSFLFPTP